MRYSLKQLFAISLFAAMLSIHVGLILKYNQLVERLNRVTWELAATVYQTADVLTHPNSIAMRPSWDAHVIFDAQGPTESRQEFADRVQRTLMTEEPQVHRLPPVEAASPCQPQPDA